MGKTKDENVSLSFLNDNMCVVVLKLKGKHLSPNKQITHSWEWM